MVYKYKSNLYDLLLQNIFQKLCTTVQSTTISSECPQKHTLGHANKEENGGLTLLANSFVI